MKKIKNNHWYALKDQSLAVYTRNAGFDLAVFKDYSEPVRSELKKRAIKEALVDIKYACDEKGFDITAIKSGIYAISLSNPLSIQYEKGRSQVIYIGMGNIMGRIKTHFQSSLFDFMQSLSGANFDFHFARPALPSTKPYFKHVEYLMLEDFSNRYGRFPILNNNAGSDKGYKAGTDWWKKPLKESGKKPLWELKPTKFLDFTFD